MNDDFNFSTGAPSEEMQQYLQMYVDETSEQLDALVESLLVLESRPADADQLNDAFRLIHSIKGSSAMMGLDGITMMTHQLENHFERLRSGLQQLDQRTMGLVLRCIDFLRECNRRLREGDRLGSAPELLEELHTLSTGTAPAAGSTVAETTPSLEATEQGSVVAVEPIQPKQHLAASSATEPLQYRVLLHFEAELPLVELKAELVLERLKVTGTIQGTQPPRSGFATLEDSHTLQVLLTSDRPQEEIRSAANVDGVALIELETGTTEFAAPDVSASQSPAVVAKVAVAEPTAVAVQEASSEIRVPVMEVAVEPLPSASPEAGDHRSKVVETVRVDTERLDKLMNLAGELVVNKARFVQIARQMSPAFRKSSVAGRARAFGESMRRTIQRLKLQSNGSTNPHDVDGIEDLQELEAEIDALEEQARLWEEGRRGFTQITEAIDQMTRVSDSLQRGVLDTRMVPVAPLFNRFKRVVRDIAIELGKKVILEIHGENTELDKRMIDELGDPLVHLVRNAIDHGIEATDVRLRRGKSESGTLRLNAAHSGNNVLITVQDDGGGIPIEKVRQRIVERGLVTATAAESLSAQEVLEFIWHPGFSTAEAVSDISGRGVGMDIVKTRIANLNGTIDIEHSAGRGTTFTIRLPLTLAIIRSLLFRVPHGVFAVPMDNVREIVSVPTDQIISVHGRQTFDVRGEFIPLVDIDNIFEWHSGSAGPSEQEEAPARRINVVILHSGSRTMGLRVNELHGGQDIVIKSLAENFIHIRGLSGASILGDGSVCLLLDVAAAIAMAAAPHSRTARVSAARLQGAAL